MGLYRKKPVVIEAFQWTGDQYQTEYPEWVIKEIANGKITFKNEGTLNVELLINTLEGVMIANQGDFIIKGVQGEIYPCKPDIFEVTYELVEE